MSRLFPDVYVDDRANYRRAVFSRYCTRGTCSGSTLSNTPSGLNRVFVVYVFRLTAIVRSAMSSFMNSLTASESSFSVVSVIVISGTAASVVYLGVRVGTFASGVSVNDITLIWRIGPWFLAAVAWINSMWVVVMDVGMLGLIYFGVGAITSIPGVSWRNILLVASIWRI